MKICLLHEKGIPLHSLNKKGGMNVARYYKHFLDL